MGVKKSRILALLVAVVMVFTSAIGVFASSKESIEQGTSNADKTVVHYSKGTVTVPEGATVTANGKKVKVSGTTAKGIKNGALVVITTKNGTSYRWMKTAKIKKATKKKVTWKKVKGAKYYLVKVVKGGKTYYKKVKGTSITAKKLGLKSLKKASVRVRPLKVKSGTVYAGALCKAKKVK